MGKDFWANLTFCLVLAVFLIFGVTRISAALTSKGLLVRDPQPSAGAVPLLKDVKITQYRVIMDQSHKVAANFYIRNNLARDVMNVHVVCDFFDEKGNYMDRERWILSETFPAGEEHKSVSILERFVNMNGASDCRVTELQLAEDPIFKLHRSAAGPGKSGAGESGHASPRSSGH